MLRSGKRLSAITVIIVILANAAAPALATTISPGEALSLGDFSYTYTGDLFVDAHSLFAELPTYQFIRDYHFAEDCLSQINSFFGKTLATAYNAIRLNFDDAYIAIVADIMLSMNMQDCAQSIAELRQAERLLDLMDVIEGIADTVLISGNELSNAIAVIDEYRGIVQSGGTLSAAQLRDFNSVLEISDSAINQAFIQGLLTSVTGVTDKLGILYDIYQGVELLSDIVSLYQALDTFQTIGDVYLNVLKEDIEMAELLGEERLAKALRPFYEAVYEKVYGDGLDAADLSRMAIGAKTGDIVTTVLDVFLDEVVQGLASAANALGLTLSFVTTTGANGTVAAGVGRALGGVYLGYSIGTFANNILFNTDDVTECFKFMEAVSAFERVNSKTLKLYEDILRLNPSSEAAQNFHSAFTMQLGIELNALGTYIDWMSSMDAGLINWQHDAYVEAIEAAEELMSSWRDKSCCERMPYLERVLPNLYNPEDSPASAQTTGEPVPTPTTSPTSDLYYEVREVPHNDMDAVLILDTSGSMSEYNLRANKQILTYAKEAAQAFIDQALKNNINYRVGLGVFNSSATSIMELTDVSGIDTLRSAIWRLGANGQTNISAGFDLGAQMLRDQGRPNARHMLLLFSDGVHNTGGVDPVTAGWAAQQGSGGVHTDIYTIGMVGALSEPEREQIRKVLNQPYAVRYIEIDGEKDLEGVFYLLGSVSGNSLSSYNVLRVTGCTEIELTNTATGERLGSMSNAFQASFGSLYVTTDGYEKIFFLSEDTYQLRVAGGKTGGRINIHMETLDGKGVVTQDIRHYQLDNGNPGTRLIATLSFTNDMFQLSDMSFNPLDPNAIDPFTGQIADVEIEPANGFLTRGKADVYSAPSSKSTKVGSVGQGERYKDEFRVIWSDGNWYFIEYDLGTGNTRNGVKRGYVEKTNVEIVDGWVPQMFSLGISAELKKGTELTAMPYNFGSEIKVVRNMKEGDKVTIITYYNAPDGYAYAYVEYGSGSKAERGYLLASAVH